VRYTTLEQVWDAAALEEFVLKAVREGGGGELPEIRPEDGAQVIFTTGSTGAPKAALLTHLGITVQNYCLGTAFEFPESRILNNLPPSHVGCQSELLMTTLFWGSTAVTLEIFDPGKSLEAIEKYRIQLVGQIPAIFCTYTSLTGDADRVAASLGHAAPVYPMSIREPMRADCRAGAAVPEGEIGHVCFRGPQTFAGYVHDQQATRQAISTDGWLYTGDMGSLDAEGLHFNGRAKWVIKPAGYQVFPGDVEEHICALSGKVASCGVVGVPHPIWVEAIVAFVEKRPGADLTEAELRKHARGLTSYKRPLDGGNNGGMIRLAARTRAASTAPAGGGLRGRVQ